MAGWRKRCFRLLAAVGAPVLFFLLVELGLRLAGFGYPTAFLLPARHNGQQTLVQNNRFGWRFFGRQRTRVPASLSFSQVKPPNTVRIFVFGESAANGDPQPRFGLPRMLEALLSLRHHGVKFELLNVAMTSINSHAILPIARDCAGADGDIWVIYMGNNEVVGPFGAGTIFGSQSPPLPLIRATLALKTTRTGQWLDSARQQLQKPSPEKSEWGGMMMFLDNPLQAEDPGMKAVYDHFERNLLDIIRVGRRSGVGVVVSTVAVNLKDCAPFASAHRADLPNPDKARWDDLYQRGIDAQAAGNNQGAAAWFRQAAQIDDRAAELRFHQASCALALRETAEAQRQFGAARDLDTLRFRCDSRLNDLTRKVAANCESGRVLLADADRAFAEQSPGGSPGQAFFYEHVHLTFEGNYLLARTIADQVEKLLPERVGTRGSARQWPAITDCARRLAWTDWNRQAAWADILARLTDPPFTLQLNHDAQLQQVRALVESLAPATRPAGIDRARKICEAALASAPDDPWLHDELASFEELAGDLPTAEAEARRALELLPSDSAGWSRFGYILARQKKFGDSTAAFRRAFELDSQDVWALHNLAQSLVELGRTGEAISEYRRALAIKPRFGLAWLGLGQVLENLGRKPEAEDCYQKALTNRIHRAAELMLLARFCQSRGWFEAAVTNYSDALLLSPSDPVLHLETGQSLEAIGRHADAEHQYATAALLAPESGQARFLYGLELGREGKAAAAAEQFREAVRLMPDVLEARLNLGVALVNQQSYSDALAHFEEVLRRCPTNALAREYVRVLRATPGSEPKQ